MALLVVACSLLLIRIYVKNKGYFPRLPGFHMEHVTIVNSISYTPLTISWEIMTVQYTCLLLLYSIKCYETSHSIATVHIYYTTANRVWLFQPQFWSSQFQATESSRDPITEHLVCGYFKGNIILLQESHT